MQFRYSQFCVAAYLVSMLLVTSMLLSGCGKSGTESYSGPRGPENGYTPLVTAADSDTYNNELLRWLGNVEGEHTRRINIADDKHNNMGPNKRILDCTVYELDEAFLEQLTTCKNLNWIRIGNRATPEHLELIADFSNLNGIDLGDANVSVNDTQLLANFPELRWLRIQSDSKDSESNAEFPALPNIEVLFVSGKHLVGACIRSSDQMPKVRTFTASNAELVDNDIKTISENWPNLEYLSLRGNDQLTEKSIVYLAKLTLLRHLDLHDSSLENSLTELENALPRCAVVD